jgi:hypothetical protein
LFIIILKIFVEKLIVIFFFSVFPYSCTVLLTEA